MLITDVQPIQNEPAIFISSKKMLAVADLHIGIESEIGNQGINTTSQTDALGAHLVKLCQKYKPKEIVLLGDIKHNIPSSTMQERRDVRDFLDAMQSYGTIHIVPGNHDGNIQRISSSQAIVHPSDGFIVEHLGFVHGHRWPSQDIMQCDQIIMAHTHPTIMLTDRLGHKSFESCWVKGDFIGNKLKERYPDSKFPKILVMPAFNPLCGGIAVNQEGVTGPLGKIMDVENAQIYLIDGALLGKVKDIR